ncbi:hypothetical protein OG21DRAFT_1527041 [Imleria badia]|nr:hypothetical protein OG21DRAFT_1527041 [Imleria badia]
MAIQAPTLESNEEWKPMYSPIASTSSKSHLIASMGALKGVSWNSAENEGGEGEGVVVITAIVSSASASCRQHQHHVVVAIVMVVTLLRGGEDEGREGDGVVVIVMWLLLLPLLSHCREVGMDEGREGEGVAVASSTPLSASPLRCRGHHRHCEGGVHLQYNWVDIQAVRVV